MQYMLMCCFEEKQWQALPESKREDIIQAYGKLVESLAERGQYLAGGRLKPVSTAATVRRARGGVSVTDGPFAETKEQFGGYHVIECRDADEAISIAKRIPTIPFGGTIEVRPLESA